MDIESIRAGLSREEKDILANVARHQAALGPGLTDSRWYRDQHSASLTFSGLVERGLLREKDEGWFHQLTDEGWQVVEPSDAKD